MDKNIIKKFAIKARQDLIEQVTNEANLLGINDDSAKEELASSTNEIKFYGDANSQGITGKKIEWRAELVRLLNDRSKKTDWSTAFADTVEEVAYTWFNRIIAIRFMEVNDYLPSRVRVLSSEEGRVDPDIIFYAQDEDLIEDLGGYSPEQAKLVAKAKETGRAYDMDQMYQMLFNKQVDALNQILPGLFEKTSDYMKLLFTPKYNSGVIKDLVTDVPEEYFDVEKEGQVEIIGWLYQFYNTEPKDLAFKKKKYTASDIPAVTQLFTPEWIVKYLIQNSLGRYWINVLKAKNIDIDEKKIATQFGWQYYMPAAPENKQEVDNDLAGIDVQDITFIDPAMGSGHILVYAFEVFLQIYKSEGYTEREAADLILQKNLFGADIDTRAFQLTYFTLMMQGRKMDRRFFNRNIALNIVDIPEVSDNIELLLSNVQENQGKQIKVTDLRNVINKFTNGNTLGSLIKTDLDSVDELKQLLDANDTAQLTLEESELEQGKVELESVINSVDLLSKKYTISVSNPPYMGSGKMDSELKKYVLKNYPDSKSDLFAVFMERLIELTKKNGYIAMITQHSWMFLSSFDKLRQKLQNKTIINLAHLGPRAFEEIGGEVVQSVSFVLQNKKVKDYIGTYERLTDFNTAADKEQKYLEAVIKPDLNYVYRSNQTNFEKIPGAPVAYWISNKFLDSFKFPNLGRLEKNIMKGIFTGENKKYLRFWHEINAHKIGKKWQKYSKGGNYRRWYGNLEYVIDWENDGKSLKHSPKSGLGASKYFGKASITWTKLSSSKTSFRFNKDDIFFDDASPSIVLDDMVDKRYLLAFLNSKLVLFYLSILSPTLNYQVGEIKKLPFNFVEYQRGIFNEKVNLISDRNYRNSMLDWNNFEISWDFVKHPLLSHIAEHKQNWTIEAAYNQWEQESLDRFNQLKANEEELNKIFIDLYGLEDELTPEEEDKDVSVRKADKERDIKSFLSYFIGCVFGRYSLDSEGLAFAGGEWDSSKYHSFVPNEDNVIVLTDDDYFGDHRDIIHRLKEFLTVTFGKENLYKNLDFIASALDQKKLDKGVESQQIIRDYFLNDFFKKEHLKTYQKRPIYWEMNSGKAKGFKALIYQHRYDMNTMAMVRSEYLHELQGAYENALKVKENQKDNETDKKMVKIFDKEITNLKKKVTELVKFDQELQHVASQQIDIDLDDGVVVNHKKVQADTKILTPIK